MAWNGSNNSTGKSPNQSTNRRIEKSKNSARPESVPYRRGLLAGIVAIIVAGIAIWWMLRDAGGEDEQTAKPATPRAIAEVQPIIPAAKSKPAGKEPVAEEGKEDIRDLPNGLQMKYHPDGSPAWAAPRQKPGKTFTNRVQNVLSREQEIFKNSADAEIAMMLNVEPGTQIIGSNDFAGFNERFQEALKEQIVLSDDDDEDTKALKQAVIDVREDFKKRISQGENLSETMVQVRKDLQELGLYREELKAHVQQIAQAEESDRLTENDFKDLIDAANLMLEDRGAKPISVPAFIKYRFERDIEEE